MPPFRQQFPLHEPSAPAVGDDVSHLMTTESAPSVGDDVSHLMSEAQPSAPEQESWLQTAGDVAKGFAKGAAHTVLDIGDFAERVFDPASALREPNAFVKAAREATAYQNTPERVGGGLETAAELAAPVAEAGVALARKAPAVLSKAAPMLAEAAKTGASELAAHYLGGLPFGSGTAARIVLKSALDSARKAAPEVVNTGGRLIARETPTVEEALSQALAELRTPEAPARITTPPQPDLPPGYQPRTTVPAEVRRRLSRVASPTPSPAVVPSEIPSRVPFDVADQATIDRLPQEADLSKPTLQRVPLKDLVATQEGLSPDVVRGHLEHPPADLSKVPARAVGRFDPDAVTVIRGADGRNYLSGGTHRATAALLRGEPDIQAIVYPSKASTASAAVAEKVPAAVRPYFLKPLAEMAETAEATPAVAAKKVLTPSDLPASWRAHTGQDLFPLQGSVEKDAIREFQQELKDQGLSVTEAIASVSKNKDLPVQLRTQLLGVLMKTRPN